MNFWTRSIHRPRLVAAPLLAISTAADAGVGDLLVAPTRLVLDGRKGAEVILNNIGDEPATYRVSVEFRRMTEAGDLVDVTTPSAADKTAEDMIVYAPRKVTLAPNEPQAIRIAARPARPPRRRISGPPAVPRDSAGDIRWCRPRARSPRACSSS